MHKLAAFSLLVFFLVACNTSEVKTIDRITADVNTKGGLTYVNGQLFSGTLTEYSASKTLISRVNYKNGKQYGTSEIWYNNGQLKESRYFENNKKSGEHLGYWENGKQAFLFHFEEGKYIDTLKEWYANGQLYKLEYYEDGMQIGRQKAWRKDGEMYLNYDVKNGRKYGNAGIKHCKSLWNEVDSI